jgi:hypothetical protein
MSIPSPEPSVITAGDTAAWTKSLPDYLPSAGWTLNYALQGPSEITFSSATNSGATFAISLTTSTTASWAPGLYALTAYVTKAGERYTVDRRTISILADPAQALGSTHASRTLALIEAALEGRIPRGLESHVIAGQSISKIPIPELYKLKLQYQREVAAEQARIIKPRRTIGFRFVRP